MRARVHNRRRVNRKSCRPRPKPTESKPLSSPFGVKHLVAVRAAVLARRERPAKRFKGPADWLRLAVLG